MELRSLGRTGPSVDLRKTGNQQTHDLLAYQVKRDNEESQILYSETGNRKAADH